MLYGCDQRVRHHAGPSDIPTLGLLIRGLWVRSPRGPQNRVCRFEWCSTWALHGSDPGCPLWRRWVDQELLHHGDEIALLRDLHRFQWLT
jgi:hypothetical protein